MHPLNIDVRRSAGVFLAKEVTANLTECKELFEPALFRSAFVFRYWLAFMFHFDFALPAFSSVQIRFDPITVFPDQIN